VLLRAARTHRVVVNLLQEAGHKPPLPHRKPDLVAALATLRVRNGEEATAAPASANAGADAAKTESRSHSTAVTVAELAVVSSEVGLPSPSVSPAVGLVASEALEGVADADAASMKVRRACV
jgi:hypothetical protein